MNTTLNKMYATPGIYLFSGGSYFAFLEVDGEGKCHQLDPQTFVRDGELTREGWDEQVIAALFGPLPIVRACDSVIDAAKEQRA